MYGNCVEHVFKANKNAVKIGLCYKAKKYYSVSSCANNEYFDQKKSLTALINAKCWHGIPYPFDQHKHDL